MEQQIEESETRSIDARVLDFALDFTYAEIGFLLKGAEPGEMASSPQVSVSEEQTESVLWESFNCAFANGFRRPDQNKNTQLIAQEENLLYVIAGSYLGATDTKPKPDSYLVRSGSLIGTHPTQYSYRLAAIRRLGMALAFQGSESLSGGEELTGEIKDYAKRSLGDTVLAFLLNPFSKSTENEDANGEGWYHDAVKKLRELKELSHNWDGYGSEAPNNAAITEALKVLYELKNIDFEPSRILASAAGGVSFCFFRPQKYGEVECYNTGETVAIIKDTHTNWRRIWEVDSIEESVKNIRNYLLGGITK